ncbi:unnamed protein product [Jaminaea pallidilutea]
MAARVSAAASSSAAAWQPRASTPNGPHPSSPPKRQPSPLAIAAEEDDAENMDRSRDRNAVAGTSLAGSKSMVIDQNDAAATPSRHAKEAAKPPTSAWRKMPGFEELDESWNVNGSQQSANASKVEGSQVPKDALVKPAPVLTESLAKSNRMPSAATDATFFDAPMTQATSSQAQSRHSSSNAIDGAMDKPKRTWNEAKGGPRSTHLRPHPRPVVPSLTDSEVQLQPGPSSSVMRKRSQDVRKLGQDGVNVVSSEPEMGQDGEGTATSRSSSQSSSSSLSERKQGAWSATEPRTSDGSRYRNEGNALDDAPNGGTDSSDTAGVTASEGAGITFVHHEDASDLPPVLRPAWKAGQDGAADPRTPGGKKPRAIMGGDMFTPLKLQTMFRTPTPPDVPPVKDLATIGEPDGNPVADDDKPNVDAVASESQPKSATQRESMPNSAARTPSLQKKPSSMFNSAFDFRSPLPDTKGAESPFAHLATPRTAQKKRGLSADAYAHLGRTPSGSASNTATGASLPMRLFVFGSGQRKRPGITSALQSPEKNLDQAGAEQEADKERAGKIQEAVALYEAKIQAQERSVSRTRDAEVRQERGEREFKRLRLDQPTATAESEDQRDLTSPTAQSKAREEQNESSGPSLSPMRLVARSDDIESASRRQAAQQKEESPRKLFRKFSAAGQVERDIMSESDAAEQKAFRMSQWSDDERRRDAEVAALEDRIAKRREMRAQAAAAPKQRAPSDPPRVVLVDENGQSETLRPGMSRTYSSSSVAQSSGAGVTSKMPEIAEHETMEAAAPTSIAAGSSKQARPGRSVVETIAEASDESISVKEQPSADPASERAGSTDAQQGSATPSMQPTVESDEGEDSFRSIRSAQSRTSATAAAAATHATSTSKTPKPQLPVPMKNIKSTPPILRPTYALHQNSQPKSGSSLRNEVVMSDADDSTRTSNASQSISVPDVAQVSLPVAATPIRSISRTSVPPRSILKTAPASSQSTPNRIKGEALSTPRSISFADGKTTGKMFASSPLAEIGKDADESWADQSTKTVRQSSRPRSQAEPGYAESADSVRTARIQELLEQVRQLALSGDDPNQLATSLRDATEATRADHPWEAPSPTSRFSAPPSMRLGASQRSLARSIDGGRSVWSFADSAADKTFLTQASFDVAHERIVEVLTDVAPFVPDWEELTTLDASARKLDSVVRLKEFVPNLERCHLDNNAISYLTGLPAALRTLTISHNKIPSIVSFGHLLKLETLDVSYNDLDELNALECLVHLRHLKADNCGVRSLAGIEKLEHLSSLSLRGNKLQTLDLSKTSWRRLTSLDVSHNSLTTVRSLARCKHLKVLNLASNDLKRIDLGPSMPRLRVLRLSCNARLDQLDVLPAAQELETLYADFCSLRQIDHLGALSKLQNLSVRQQLTSHGGGFAWPTTQVKDARRLFLSGNAFPEQFALETKRGSAPSVGTEAQEHAQPVGLLTTRLSVTPFANVVYLELAACQLETLPGNFAQLFPAVHQLNVDHNLFSRLPRGCFSGLRNLKRVSMVGCRIKSTRNLIEAFEGCRALSVLDTRMNPATLGLYPPVLAPALADAASSSTAFLSPMPNFETMRPDTAMQERRKAQKEDAAERKGLYEKSFFHKRHPTPLALDSYENDAEAASDGDVSAQRRRTAGSAVISSAVSDAYALSDSRFVRTLPKSFALSRTLHRGTLGMVCSSLTWLDGLLLDDEEVARAEELLLNDDDTAATVRPQNA